MTNVDTGVAVVQRATARIIYLGPTHPHWDVEFLEGEQGVVDEFRFRVMARLLLIPRHDPQFRRNRDRVTADAEREGIAVHWIGVDER